MDVLKVGIDLVEINRFERVINRRPGVTERLFTNNELEYAGARPRSAAHLAARFAGKEAVIKTLDLGLWSFREIEIVSTDGRPSVKLSGFAAECAAELGVRVELSLTHSYSVAGAVAVAFTL